MRSFLIFLLSFTIVAGQAQNQQAPPAHKVHEVFMDYLTEKINLTPAEKKQLSPLVIRYLGDSKNISKNNKDPLLREQERIELKINYRKRFIPIIGEARATRFFSEEQSFRRKIREELKKRNVNKN